MVHSHYRCQLQIAPDLAQYLYLVLQTLKGTPQSATRSVPLPQDAVYPNNLPQRRLPLLAQFLHQQLGKFGLKFPGNCISVLNWDLSDQFPHVKVELESNKHSRGEVFGFDEFGNDLGTDGG